MNDSEFWRLDWVRNETGLCTSSIYEGMKDGWFPRNFAVTKQARAWLASEVESWKAEKLAARARARQASRMENEVARLANTNGAVLKHQ